VPDDGGADPDLQRDGSDSPPRRVRPLDQIEIAALLECFRRFHRDVPGLKTAKLATNALAGAKPGITAAAALKCVNGQYVKDEERPALAHAVLELLSENHAQVLNSLRATRTKHTADYIANIFGRHKHLYLQPAAQVDVDKDAAEDYADEIFENWKKSDSRGTGVMLPGIYQIFRRYKPPRSYFGKKNAKAYDWSDPTNHAIICELLYVDPDNLESALITSEGNKYIGTIHTNHEDILYGMFQRRPGENTGFNHRFIAMKLERTMLPFNSALCLKVGDSTYRPLASECLLVRIPATAEHADLRDQFAKLRKSRATSIKKDSVIWRYITDPPPAAFYNPKKPSPEWARVKFVRDFPGLLALAKDHGGITFFREPSRTIEGLTITQLAQGVYGPQIEIKVFRHPSSRSRPRGKPSERRRGEGSSGTEGDSARSLGNDLANTRRHRARRKEPER
jgi:hypothetical protein